MQRKVWAEQMSLKSHLSSVTNLPSHYVKKFILLSWTLIWAARHNCHALLYLVTLPYVLKTHYARSPTPSSDHYWENRVAMQIQKRSSFSRSPLFQNVLYYEAKFRINWILWMTLSDHIKWGTVCQETAKLLDPAEQ